MKVIEKLHYQVNLEEIMREIQKPSITSKNFSLLVNKNHYPPLVLSLSFLGTLKQNPKKNPKSDRKNKQKLVNHREDK